MIKSDKGVVEMKGRQRELLADIGVILKSARENFGDELVDLVVEKSKMSDEEIHAEAEKAKEKIVKDFLSLIFNKGEK